ncbi:Protein R09F10.1 [Aphelenchoides avenae]|nr:Protein R09F10.1 [Aphelenchus avenae]
MMEEDEFPIYTKGQPFTNVQTISLPHKQDRNRGFSAVVKTLIALAVALFLLALVSYEAFSYFHEDNVRQREQSIAEETFNVEKYLQEEFGSDNDTLSQFLEFAKEFEKRYETEDDALLRFSVFAERLDEIENAQANQSNVIFGVNEFTDWTDDELRKLVMSLDAPKRADIPKVDEISPETSASDGYKRPAFLDYRTQGVVSHVKNQGKCGSCWAFAVTAAVETHNALHGGKLVTLSEQQLLDCDTMDSGCGGGYRPYAFRYIKENGLVSDKLYSYEGRVDQCKNVSGERVFVSRLVSLGSNEDKIADWVAANGPITLGMNVTKEMFSYRGGVFSPSVEACAYKSVGSHAMSVVGYGELNGEPYWIFKNSWGSGYGINGGYLLMRRGVNACGLADSAFGAVINK